MAAPFLIMMMYPLSWGVSLVNSVQEKTTDLKNQLNPFHKSKRPEGYQPLEPQQSEIVDIRKSVLSSKALDLSEEVHTDEDDS